MKLIVGPGDSRQERVDAARAAWDAFESELGTPVFPYSSLELRALYRSAGDLPAFFGPVITGEQRQLKFVVRLRVLPGQREPALPTSAFRHPSQP